MRTAFSKAFLAATCAFLALAFAGCSDDPAAPTIDLGSCVGSCDYDGTPGSAGAAPAGICRSYTGSAWTRDNTKSACVEGYYTTECCSVSHALGACIVGQDTTNEWKDVYYDDRGWTLGKAQSDCATTDSGKGGVFIEPALAPE